MKLNSVCRRGLSLLLASVLMLSMCVQVAHAATETNKNYIVTDGWKVSYEWDNNEDWLGRKAEKEMDPPGVASFKARVITSNNGAKRAGKLTLYITNLYGGKADLSFDYKLSETNGTCTIDGTKSQVEGSVKKTLDHNESVVVYVESSNRTRGASIAVSITGITMTEITSDTTVKFYRPEGSGSYTVENLTDGTKDTITASSPEYKERTKPANHQYRLVATPAQDYVFVGWKNKTGAYIEGGATLETTFDKDIGIRPVFVPNTYSQYGVGDRKFFDLNEADEYARQANNKTIVLLNNGILPKDATISQGVTLLIPYNAEATVNTDVKPDTVKTGGTQTPFRTLIIPDGVTLTVYGALNVNGQVLKLQSLPTGPYGLITLDEGGKIVLKKANDGTAGKLYCWGYINGKGTVIAENGAQVYECFQLRGWRGGSVSWDMNNNDKNVFLINQYYIQNVEAALELQYGAEEYVYASVTVSYKIDEAQASATEIFIGKEDKGMFQLQEEGSKLIKKYDPDTDRMEFEIQGKMLIASLSLELIPRVPILGNIDSLAVKMNTRNYVLPIHGGFTVNISSGTTTIDGPKSGDLGQRVCWLPGSELTVAKGATLNVNSDMFVYDRDQWVGSSVVKANDPVAAERKYAYTADLLPVSYATTRKEKDKRTADKLTDAKVDVNGTINISGHLYTTAKAGNNSGEKSDGANITSSLGGGIINFLTNTQNTENTHQVRQGGKEGKEISYDTISCTSAKLRNANDAKGNEQFTLTAGAQAGWTYTYLTEALSANPEKYKDMWYLFKVTYVDVASGKSEVKYITTDSDSFKVPGADASSILKAETKKGTATCSFEGSTLNVSGINAGEDRECTIWITNTKQEFTIKFDGNEPESGKLSGSTNSMTVPMSETTVTLPDCGFTATGWKFVGWSLKKDTAASSTELLKTSATQGQLGNPAAGDEVTLYAIWQPDKVYSVTVSWSKGLEYTYIPNEYTWNATEMRYEHTREAGWIGANDSNPTVTISNGGDKTDVTYGHINAGIQYTPNDAAYNGFTMDFLVDNMSMGKGSATLATKLAPKNSVTTTMKLEGTPFIGMDTGKPITIGTVALTLTTAD